MIFLKRLEIYHQSLHDSVFERYKLLPQISALSATLLVVATFNEKLLPLTGCVRILLIILLALIPVSLVGYLWELECAEEDSSENINRLGNREETIPPRRNAVTAWLPRFVTAVISVVIIFIIVAIVNNFSYVTGSNLATSQSPF